MYRTFVILRHTFLETVVQPIYTLLITVGIGILAIFGMLPFFTLGEDTVMFKSVGLDVILLLVLIATLFATSKSIFEEIEDRTMLTLMSKPVRRWEVLVGLRNMFRDPTDMGSIYDELLVVRAPKRVIGGVLIKF